jgi:siroheme decarboxylase
MNSALLNPLEYRLLNDFQRDFPLCPDPWSRLGQQLQTPGELIRATLHRLCHTGLVSRVGAVFAPNRLGASTLAAMAVPEARLAEVAALVSSHPGINHNYQREHACNLWFVASSRDQTRLAQLLAELGHRTGCPPIALPLEEEFHIDLGFDLARGTRQRTRPALASNNASATVLSPADWALVTALHEGLPWTPRPYQALARVCGLTESSVLERLAHWQADGLMRRFGVIVQHRPLGYRANGMAVWALPPAEASRLGPQLAACEGVHLCYRRRPAPGWPYTLYAMLHGQARDEVEARHQALSHQCGLAAYPSALLFSTTCFKQCGARYEAPREPALCL